MKKITVFACGAGLLSGSTMAQDNTNRSLKELDDHILKLVQARKILLEGDPNSTVYTEYSEILKRARELKKSELSTFETLGYGNTVASDGVRTERTSMRTLQETEMAYQSFLLKIEQNSNIFIGIEKFTVQGQ